MSFFAPKLHRCRAHTSKALLDLIDFKQCDSRLGEARIGHGRFASGNASHTHNQLHCERHCRSRPLAPSFQFLLPHPHREVTIEVGKVGCPSGGGFIETSRRTSPRTRYRPVPLPSPALADFSSLSTCGLLHDLVEVRQAIHRGRRTGPLHSAPKLDIGKTAQMPTSRKHAVPRFERDPCAIIWPDWALPARCISR